MKEMIRNCSVCDKELQDFVDGVVYTTSTQSSFISVPPFAAGIIWTKRYKDEKSVCMLF
jgi:hypothetical protein